MIRNIRGKVMVHISYPHAGRQEVLKGLMILIEGNVENCNLVTSGGLNFLQEDNLPFDTGNQDAIPGFGQPELMQGTQPIRIAIEYIKTGHVFLSLVNWIIYH